MIMKKIGKKQIFGILGFLYFLFFITMGTYTPYLNIYYERLGFNGSQMGLISAVGLILAMICSPLWGAITDKTHRYKSMIAFLLIANAISALVWFKQTFFLSVFVTSLFVSVFRSNINHLLDGLAIQFCHKEGLDFGKIRSLGSFGYLFGSFIIGNCLFLLFKKEGPYIYVLAFAAILAACLLIFVPSPSVETKKEVRFKENIKALIKNQDFIFITCFSFFSSMVMDSCVNYIGNHVVSTLNETDFVIGLATCAMVLPEIFIMMKVNRMFQRHGVKTIYLLSCILQIIRFLCYAFVDNTSIFLLVSMVHGFMVAVGTVGNVTFIHQKVPTEMLATAMSVYGSVTIIGYACLAQLFGVVYQLWGSCAIFLIGFFFTCVAFLMVLKTKRLEK